MTVRWGFRLIRAAFIGAIAWVGYQLLDRAGQAWLFAPLALAALVAFLAALAWAATRARARRQRWARWEADASQPERREQVLAEARRELEAIGDRRGHDREERARIALLVAELLDQSERSGEALAALREIDLSSLPSPLADEVRHARVALLLELGELEDAELLLKARRSSEPQDDRAMSLRFEMLEAILLIEHGDRDRARSLLDDIEQRAEGEEALIAEELRAIRASIDGA